MPNNGLDNLKINQPTTHCINCSKKLESSGEFQRCFECQRKHLLAEFDKAEKIFND